MPSARASTPPSLTHSRPHDADVVFEPAPPASPREDADKHEPPFAFESLRLTLSTNGVDDDGGGARSGAYLDSAPSYEAVTNAIHQSACCLRGVLVVQKAQKLADARIEALAQTIGALCTVRPAARMAAPRVEHHTATHAPSQPHSAVTRWRRPRRATTSGSARSRTCCFTATSA